MNYPQTVTAPVGVIHVETGYGPARFWGIAFNSTAPDVPKDLVNIVGAKTSIDGVEKNESEILTWLGQEFPNGGKLMATAVLLGPDSYIRCSSVDFSFA